MLSTLCEMEETVIREQAVKTLELITTRIKDNDIQDHIVPLAYKFI